MIREFDAACASIAKSMAHHPLARTSLSVAKNWTGVTAASRMEAGGFHRTLS